MKILTHRIYQTFLTILSITLVAFQASGQSEILFEGQKKTRESYLQALGRNCLETHGALEREAIQQCILNSQLFSAVVVEKRGENLLARVDERWTLIPIPYASASNGGERAYGLFVLESNFLGRGQTLAAGLSRSNRTSNGSLFFQDKKLFFTPWSLSFAVSASKSDVILFGKDSERLSGFSEKAQKAFIGPGYEIARDLVLSLQLSQSLISSRPYDSYNLDPPDGRTSSVETVLRFRRSNYRFYFQEGLDASLGFRREVDRTDEEEFGKYATGSARFTQAVYESHALTLQLAAASMQGGQVGNYFRSGESPGFRGIPKEGAWSRAYRTAGIDYMIPLRFMTFGTWTAGAFAEAGRLDTLDASLQADRRAYQSFGLGTYIYLKKIALPGIGLEIGSNSSFESRFVAFSLGLGSR